MDRATAVLRLVTATLGCNYPSIPLVRAIATACDVPPDVLAATAGYRFGRAKAPGRPYAIGHRAEVNIIVSQEAMEVLGS